MAAPSIHQLEKFIRSASEDSFNVGFTKHAEKRMRERYVTRSMVMEALRMGCILMTPEPDMRHPGLKCRMERLVAGVVVGAVVYVDHPAPDLTVVTVMDLGE